MVAIARALQDQEGAHSGLLVLDEPTAALPAEEVDLLLGSLRRYAEAGQTILYISHRLDEVSAFADRATVLRDGRLAGTLDRGQITHDNMVELITGRSIDRAFPVAPPSASAAVVLGGPQPHQRAGARRRASTCTGARCSASPACWGRAAPSCCGPCSAPPPSATARSSCTAGR